jgi:tRNA nucleotidyltransferase (CCA-adding enzyme)
LHDTVEDTSVTPADITKEFGPKIAKLVIELTDVSKPEDGNRKTRKAIDRDKLAGVSAEAQTVKYADLISNGKDIAQNDPKFAKVYHAEKADLLRVMTKGNQNLRKQAIALLPDELKSVANESKGYFTRTKSQSSKGKTLLRTVKPDLEKTLKDIKHKLEPDSSGNRIIITVDKSDVDKVRKLVGLPNLTKVVSEEGPFGVISRKLGHVINKKAYINMAQMMHKILTRKYKETGGKIRHGLGYYAMMLAMQTNNKINWRELEKEYLNLYGNELFEGWSNKYKKSINCSNPKGFSQKAHCAGKKKKESVNEEALNVKPIITPAIKKLDKIFKANDYEVRIVGGAVRDIALGKEPKDIDFATDATPDEMMNMLDKAKVKTVPTGIEHGTITAVIDNEPFEITTLRADKETDGRRAEVEFVRSWEEDAKRRDLTYNAMSMDIDGNIYDYNGGMDDLQDKVSKFVGDPAERIKEDYLRILRYFRFQSKLDNPKWDEDTLKAIKDNADGIKGISVERIWQEMSKLLMSSNAEESLEWMNKTGVNELIGLGGIKPSKLGEPVGPIVSLAILLDNSNIARQWKMSKYDTEMLDFLIKHKGQNIDIKQAKDMLVKGVSQDHLLAWANMHNKNDVYDAVHSFEKPEFPVNGQDLLAMGYKAGPNLGQLLSDLQDQWMKSNYKLSKEELLKKVPVQESIVLEKVSRFMTGHGITYKGKKHDEMEVEVVGVDNVNRKYQVMIMRPEEYFGTNVMMSARFMHRGPWVKTKIPDYMGAFAKSDVKEWVYPAIQGAAHLARTYGPKIASKLMSDPGYKIAGGLTSGGGAAYGAYNYVKDKFGNKTKKQTKSSGGPSIPQAENLDEEFNELHYILKNEVPSGHAVMLTKLAKFHDGADELEDYVPERKGKRYALHPDNWKGTYYSLTGKDTKKINYYKPEIIKVPNGSMVADMAIANKFYRTKDADEKKQLAKEYKDSMVPFGSDISSIKFPEILIGLNEEFINYMRTLMTEAEDSTPEVYVDMDGVLVDFFTEWAKLMNVKTYRDIPKKDIPKALKKIVDTPNFWEDLPTLSGYKELLGAIKKVKGKYKILSSPLANDPNVDPGKREWVRKNLGFFRPEQVIIDHNKSKYAKQPDGSPNLLIDDFGKNVRAWQSAGGIAIKHHTSTTNDTVNAINKVFSNTVNETGGVGRVVPGINTTVDVGPNEIVKQAKKFGNDVNKDGFPKKLLRPKKK